MSLSASIPSQQHHLGLVEALARVEEVGEERVGGGSPLRFRQLDGLAIGLLGLVIPLTVGGQEGREGRVGGEARLDLDEPAIQGLRLGGLVATPVIVRQQQQRRSLLGSHLHRASEGLTRLVVPLQRLESARLQHPGGRPLRLGRQHLLGLGESLLDLGLLSEQQELAVLEPRVQVARVEAHGLLKLPVGLADLLLADQGLGETVVGIGEVRVHLQHVLELDDGLRVLPLLEVGLGALPVFRKAFRVVLTGSQNQGRREQGAGAREMTENHGDSPCFLQLRSRPKAYLIAEESTGSAASPADRRVLVTAVAPPRRMRDAHTLDHVVELAAAHPKQLRRFLLDIAGAMERLENHRSLDLVESDSIGREFGTPAAAALVSPRLGKTDVVGLDLLSVRHQYRSLDHVAQLANVAGPAVSLDAGESFVG